MILQVALLTLAPQLTTEPRFLAPPGAGPADGFGTSVAAEGELLAVGATENVGNAFAAYGSGFVTLLRRTSSGWTFDSRVDAPSGQVRDAFGAAVSIECTATRDTLVVTAPRAGGPVGNGPGRVHVFERAPLGPWTHVASFDGNPARDSFGTSVAIEGDTLAVGQPDFDGDVHLFVRGPGGAWAPAGVLPKPPTVFSSAEFGRSLAMEQELLVVGASGEDAQSYDSGAAYVYRRANDGTYQEEARLEHPSAATVTGHGRDVDVTTDLAIERVVVGSQAGVAFVWSRTAAGWVTEAVLEPFDGEDDGFGEAVAIDGARVVVGSPRRLALGYGSGAALDFQLDASGGWIPHSLLHPTSIATAAANNGEFGAAVALAGDTALVGAFRVDAAGLDSGTVAAFDVGLRLGESHCAGRVNSAAESAALAAHGSLVASDGDLGFDVVGLPSASTGYLLAAPQREQIPALGGGAGDLCLGGTISRFLDTVATSGPSGALGVDVDFALAPPSAQLIAGSTWSFQWWYRDVGPTPTSNTSHAIELQFE